MADFREQGACLKFCFKLGKTATECYEMLKTAFGERVIPKHFSGFPGLRQAELRLMMTNVLGDQCPVQKGIVHKEFVPPGQTVNAAFYVEVLKHLRENVRRKRPD